MSRWFLAAVSGAVLAGVLSAAPVSGPAIASPLIGPASRATPGTLIQLAKCIRLNRTCVTSNECCSGTCADRGSKGMVCVR